jgi:hypothetical protein
MIECQVAAIVKLIKEMIEKDLARYFFVFLFFAWLYFMFSLYNIICSVEVKREVQQNHNSQLQKYLVNTVWASGCKSWYLSDDKEVSGFFFCKIFFLFLYLKFIL